MLMMLQLSDLEIQVHHREVRARVCVRACVRSSIKYLLPSPATPRTFQSLFSYSTRISSPEKSLRIMKRFWVQNSCFDKYH